MAGTVHGQRAGLFAVVAVVLCGLFAPPSAAAACTKTWNNPAGGAFDLGTNWTPAGVPTATDDVCIEMDGTYTVSVSTPAQVNSLTLGTTTASGTQTLSLAANNSGLRADAGISNGPHGRISTTSTGAFLDVRSATLDNAGTITSGRGMTIDGNVSNTGALSTGAASGGATMGFGSSTGSQAILDNHGTISLGSGGIMTGTFMSSDQAVTNDTGGHITACDRCVFNVSGTYNASAGTTDATCTPFIGPFPSVRVSGRLNYVGSGSGCVGIVDNSVLTGMSHPGQSLSITGGSSPITVNSIGFTNGGSTTLGSAVTWLGDLTNAGTLQISANLVYTAGTLTQTIGTTMIGSGASLQLAGGTLAGTGTITGGTVNNSGGQVAPSIGTLRFSGDYIQGSGGSLDISVNRAAAGQFSQLSVGGSVTLGGTLAVRPSTAYAASATSGDRIPFLTYGGSRTGAFASTTVTPPLRCRLSVAYDDSAKTASALVSGCPAPAPHTPALTNFHQSHRKWREGKPHKHRPPVGTTFSFTLDQPATVSLVFNQRLVGRKVKGKCVAKKKNNQGKPRCKRTVRRGMVTVGGHAGSNSISFKGRISAGKKLGPGRYTVTITATNAAGQQSKPHTLDFRIVK